MQENGDNFLIATTEDVDCKNIFPSYDLWCFSLKALFELAQKCFLMDVKIDNNVVGKITSVNIQTKQKPEELYFALYCGIQFNKCVETRTKILKGTCEVASIYSATDGPTVIDQIDVMVVDGIKRINDIILDGIILE